MNVETMVPSKHALAEMLLYHPRVEAAALYGSVARGDSEAHSDIDLLVVCGSSCEEDLYNEIVAVLSQRFDRVSVSVYSRRELEFLAKAKSLFLLHLKREALVLFDHAGFLERILATFEPRASYAEDFRRSLDLTSPLRTMVSGVPNELHRLAYLYSLFRVYGVYLLAERGIFEFSKARMSATLAEGHPRQEEGIDLLSGLRVLNANFFSGGAIAGDSFSSPGDRSLLRMSTRALGELIKQPFEVIERPYADAVSEFVRACSNGTTPLGFRLRSWFLLLVYDGLNAYCERNGRRSLILNSFSESALGHLVDPVLPRPVRNAAAKSLEYLRNYHVKYSLSEERRVHANQACTILEELAAVA
jgi:predicted nucleotidyltransferase